MSQTKKRGEAVWIGGGMSRTSFGKYVDEELQKGAASIKLVIETITNHNVV